MDLQQESTLNKRIHWLISFCKSFGLLITYELIEELLEELIAWSITTLAAKALSFLLVVVLTQVTKVTVKSITKILILLLKPIIKKAVYREGNDKLKTLAHILNKVFRTNIEIPDNSKELIGSSSNSICENNNKEAVIMADNEVKVSKFKQFVKRVVEFVTSNKKSILSTATSIAACVGSGGAVQMWCANTGIPNLYTWLIAAVVGIFAFILTELGISCRGWESAEQYKANTGVKEQKKEKARIEKQAAKVIKETQKKAKELALKNQQLAKEEAERQRVQEYLNQHPELLNK